MTPHPLRSSTLPHADYRRQARRIRSAFAAAPVMRLRALCELAHAHDQVPRETRPNPVVTLADGAANGFAHLVRKRMDGPVLRYSHRMRLIRAAQQSGIGRFEANLIIAAVQHQIGVRRDAEPLQPQASWLPAMIGFCATQCAIVTGVWWLMG